MGSRRYTLVSAGAARVAVLLPGPTTGAESGPAPQHLVAPARPPGMSRLFAHTPRSDDAESGHEPMPGPVPG
jgi:hypothetical protein